MPCINSLRQVCEIFVFVVVVTVDSMLTLNGRYANYKKRDT